MTATRKKRPASSSHRQKRRAAPAPHGKNGGATRSRHKKRSAKNPIPIPPELIEAYGQPLLEKYGAPILRTVQFNKKGKKKGIAKGKKKLKRNSGRTRKNPLEAAQALYEGFHGRPSGETIRVKTPIHEHKFLAGLGQLERLDITTQGGGKVRYSNFGGAILCANEKRTQMFIEGGDQSVDLKLFSIKDPVHEFEVLGICTRVRYYTVKDHLGDEGGEAIYNHKLVSRSFRKAPTLIYDTRNKLLSFAGGNYVVLDEGIEN